MTFFCYCRVNLQNIHPPYVTDRLFFHWEHHAPTDNIIIMVWTADA